MILTDESDSKIIEIINMIKDAIGDENIFLDVIAQDYNKINKLQKINNKILSIAKQQNIKTLVHNDFHYVNKDDKSAWEIALAIKDGKKMYDEERRKPT
jgi:DNA polymerase-3 subunit alpha